MTGSCLKIGVLMGGKSIEREVSFNSGRTICDHIDTTKYDVIPIFQTEEGDLYLLPIRFLHRGKIADFIDRLKSEAQKISWDGLKDFVDFVYIAVHGRYAEDGTLQGMLEVLDIPYLGTKVLGSAVGMDRCIHKEILFLDGVDVPKGFVIYPNEIQGLDPTDICKQMKKISLEFPCVVKPSHEGSSLGISIVRSYEELVLAIRTACYVDEQQSQNVIVEEKIEGMEFVCVSLQRHYLEEKQVKSEWFSLPLTEVLPEEGTGFFDYDQKYMPGRATKTTPALCTDEEREKIFATCRRVSVSLKFTTISRIDGILTKEGRVVIIDPNTLTGMGPATFLFHQAAECDMGHSQLINFLIESELQQHGIAYVREKKCSVKGAFVSTDTKNKIKIGVFFGGESNEREISLESGRNVCYKLSPHKYDIIPMFLDEKKKLFKLSQKLLIKNSTSEISNLVGPEEKIKWSNLKDVCDFVFICLHGGVGENGSVQGALEMLGIPYNGSGIFTSALCVDKYKTNMFLKKRGFQVPLSQLIEKASWEGETKKGRPLLMSKLCRIFTYPVIVKPHDDGCSMFVNRVFSEKELDKAVNMIFDKGKKSLMIEEFLQGMELTCGVYGNEKGVVLPPSQVIAKDTILSIKEKFLPGAGQNITPAKLSFDVLKLIQEVVKEVYSVIGCKGYCRIDCFYQDKDQSATGKPRVVILEINTLPALTPATCLFHQAAEVGIRPMEFIDKIVELGMEIHKKRGICDKSLEYKNFHSKK
jgi:UDP-N-acetylmuramate--alanine ligase